MVGEGQGVEANQGAIIRDIPCIYRQALPLDAAGVSERVSV